MARSGCIYGPTGSRKTTAIKHFAHYIAERTGKSTGLITLDGGGYAPCEPEVQAGMILPWRVDTATIPLPLLRKASQGYWPADANETDPARINLVPINWKEVGGIAVEGLTSISAVAMRYLPDKGIDVGGEDRAKLGGFSQPVTVNGQMQQQVFRSNTRGDYGFVQNFLYGLVMNWNSLPAEYVLFTALENKAEDDDRSPVFGPAIAGKKATSQCGAWFGDLLHAQDYPVQRTVRVPDPADPKKLVEQTVLDMTVRFHFLKHPDPATGIPFPCKPRVTPEKIGELLRAYPGGYFEPTPEQGLDLYLKKVDELAEAQGDALKGWRERMDAKLRPQAKAQAEGVGK